MGRVVRCADGITGCRRLLCSLRSSTVGTGDRVGVRTCGRSVCSVQCAFCEKLRPRVLSVPTAMLSTRKHAQLCTSTRGRGVQSHDQVAVHTTNSVIRAMIGLGASGSGPEYISRMSVVGVVVMRREFGFGIESHNRRPRFRLLAWLLNPRSCSLEHSLVFIGYRAET